jgi:hypothetical protein
MPDGEADAFLSAAGNTAQIGNGDDVRGSPGV